MYFCRLPNIGKNPLLEAEKKKFDPGGGVKIG
jgi:hypothetical protein